MTSTTSSPKSARSRTLSKTVAPPLPCFTTRTSGSGSASRTVAAPRSPHAARASSSPTNTMSAPRARSSRTRGPSGVPHSPGRWLTSKETSGRPGRRAVSSRSRTQAAVGERRRDAGEVEHPPRADRVQVDGVPSPSRRPRSPCGSTPPRGRRWNGRSPCGSRCRWGGWGRVARRRCRRRTPPIASTRWSPKPSAPTRLTHFAVWPAAARTHATLDSAPPIARSKDGTSARRPGRAGQERDHGLAERDDIHGGRGARGVRGGGSGGGHDGVGSSLPLWVSAAPLTRRWPRC